MDPAVVAAVETLRGLTVAALKIKYRELLGEESKSANKQFLFRRLAWQLQAKAEGDLSERARRRAADIADDRDLRTRAPQALVHRPPEPWSGRAAGLNGPQRHYRLPQPGTLLIRRFQGKEILVKVLESRLPVSDATLPFAERHCTGSHWHPMEWPTVLRTDGAPPWMNNSTEVGNEKR